MSEQPPTTKIVRNSDGSIAWTMTAEQTAQLRPGTYTWTPSPEWVVVPALPFSTDELQAIRKALQLLDQHGGPNYLEVGLDLPPSVVAWVLSGETP